MRCRGVAAIREKTMFKNWLATVMLTAVLALTMAAGPAKAAVTENDFYVRTTNDLVKLCSVDPIDPNYSAAIHFCQGFASGRSRSN
jgi:hypothetical protein